VFVSYYSDELGRNEIYVAPFPGPGRSRQISVDGGYRPRWRADGKEIFYIGLNGRMAVEVSVKSSSVEVGTIRQLNIPGLFDVSADGQRFLVAAPRAAVIHPADAGRELDGVVEEKMMGRLTRPRSYSCSRPRLTRSALIFSSGIPFSFRRDSEISPSQKSSSTAPYLFRSN
jgi:hypothetical protein